MDTFWAPQRLQTSFILFFSDMEGLWWKELARKCFKKKIRKVPAENNAKIKIVIQKKHM